MTVYRKLNLQTGETTILGNVEPYGLMCDGTDTYAYFQKSVAFDKNNQPIFPDDIVKFTSNGEETFYQVDFNDDAEKVAAISYDKWNDTAGFFIRLSDGEVVGNIYKNIDLLFKCEPLVFDTLFKECVRPEVKKSFWQKLIELFE